MRLNITAMSLFRRMYLLRVRTVRRLVHTVGWCLLFAADCLPSPPQNRSSTVTTPRQHSQVLVYMWVFVCVAQKTILNFRQSENEGMYAVGS